jgi:hypothetical protein
MLEAQLPAHPLLQLCEGSVRIRVGGGVALGALQVIELLFEAGATIVERILCHVDRTSSHAGTHSGQCRFQLLLHLGDFAIDQCQFAFLCVQFRFEDRQTFRLLRFEPLSDADGFRVADLLRQTFSAAYGLELTPFALNALASHLDTLAQVIHRKARLNQRVFHDRDQLAPPFRRHVSVEQVSKRVTDIVEHCGV